MTERDKSLLKSKFLWSEPRAGLDVHFILFYIFFASYAPCDLSQSSRGCDELRSYSHNAVGLAVADRTQRPVDAAGAEDEDAYSWEFQRKYLGQPISGNLPFADSFGKRPYSLIYTRPFLRIIQRAIYA
jgi:hypothetical protein